MTASAVKTFALASLAAFTLLVSVSASADARPAQPAIDATAFLKFESEAALTEFVAAHSDVERLHPRLLWAFGDRATLSRALVREAAGVDASSFTPNRAFQIPVSPLSDEGDVSSDGLDARLERTRPNPAIALDSRLWGIARLHAPKVWSATRGEKVLVAVIDTGVDLKHPALASKVEVNAAEKNGRAGVDDDGNGFIDDVFGWNFFSNTASPEDDQGHGSHVSGTIAGELAEKEFYGVAPGARVLAVKTHDGTGASREDAVVKGILYAADRGAKVINCSWGGEPEAPDYSQVLFDAIKYAGDKGALLVAAAGNDGEDNDRVKSYPSNYDLPNVLAVASTTPRDALSSFSNFGRKNVDVGAPGSSIYSARKGGGFTTESGTSMASPHVAGAAALVYAKLGAGASPAAVKKWIMDHSKAALALSGKAMAGLVDVGDLAR